MPSIDGSPRHARAVRHPADDVRGVCAAPRRRFSRRVTASLTTSPGPRSPSTADSPPDLWLSLHSRLQSVEDDLPVRLAAFNPLLVFEVVLRDGNDRAAAALFKLVDRKSVV